MARKLTTYQTSPGFFEQAIAAPLMKAAWEAWGADRVVRYRFVAMNTIQDRALAILREFEQARTELQGRAVILTNGIAGTVDQVHLDELHGLRVSIEGHEGDWPVSTLKLAEDRG